MSDKLEMPLDQFAEAVAKENARLNKRIQKLEAALWDIACSGSDWIAVYKMASKALEAKDD